MKSSFPVFEQLPAGVWPIKDYPSLHATLCECVHADEHRRVVEVSHEGGLGPVDGYTRSWCLICKGDTTTTLGFARPVKLLAVVPSGQLALS